MMRESALSQVRLRDAMLQDMSPPIFSAVDIRSSELAIRFRPLDPLPISRELQFLYSVRLALS